MRNQFARLIGVLGLGALFVGIAGPGPAYGQEPQPQPGDRPPLERIGEYEFRNGIEHQWTTPAEQGNICFAIIVDPTKPLEQARPPAGSHDTLRVFGPKGGKASVQPNPDLAEDKKRVFVLDKTEKNEKEIDQTDADGRSYAEFRCVSEKTGQVLEPFVIKMREKAANADWIPVPMTEPCLSFRLRSFLDPPSSNTFGSTSVGFTQEEVANLSRPPDEGGSDPAVSQKWGPYFERERDALIQFGIAPGDRLRIGLVAEDVFAAEKLVGQPVPGDFSAHDLFKFPFTVDWQRSAAGQVTGKARFSVTGWVRTDMMNPPNNGVLYDPKFRTRDSADLDPDDAPPTQKGEVPPWAFDLKGTYIFPIGRNRNLTVGATLYVDVAPGTSANVELGTEDAGWDGQPTGLIARLKPKYPFP